MAGKLQQNFKDQARSRAPRRKASSIRDEQRYIAATKASLGDYGVLREHSMRHEENAVDACLVHPCEQLARWSMLNLLMRYEALLPLAPDFRQLRASLKRLTDDSVASVVILDRLADRLPDDIALEALRKYLTAQTEDLKWIESSIVQRVESDPFVEILVDQPLDRFRELATGILCAAGHSYRLVAGLVDEGDWDRTRKRRAWLQVSAAVAKHSRPVETSPSTHAESEAPKVPE